jgi:transposase InsO family protein
VEEVEKMNKDYVDKILLRDMALTCENDYQFYRSRLIPWGNNMARKQKRGIFSKEKFLGGLERNLAKDCQIAYYKMNRMGRPPTLRKADKVYLAKELYPAIKELADQFKKGK